LHSSAAKERKVRVYHLDDPQVPARPGMPHVLDVRGLLCVQVLLRPVPGRLTTERPGHLGLDRHPAAQRGVSVPGTVEEADERGSLDVDALRQPCGGVHDQPRVHLP
jgi:hypothetical protein